MIECYGDSGFVMIESVKERMERMDLLWVWYEGICYQGEERKTDQNGRRVLCKQVIFMAEKRFEYRYVTEDELEVMKQREFARWMFIYSLNSFNCSGNYKNNREIESETLNNLKKDKGIDGLAVELRRFEESIDRGIEVQKDRGTEELSALVTIRTPGLATPPVTLPVLFLFYGKKLPESLVLPLENRRERTRPEKTEDSAVTEPTAQPDALISATVHPGITSTQLAAMTISDHLGNTSTLMATTSGKPSMVATSDHPANTSTIVTTTSTQPSMVTTSALPAAVTTSRHPADTTSLIPTTSVPNTRTTYSTQPDISLIFQTLLGRIDELARGTTSRLDDLARGTTSRLDDLAHS
ncbi:hypothetical protein Bca101_048380 [Brassica carinata]